MAAMEILLLLGLAWLTIAHLRLAGRTAELERQLDRGEETPDRAGPAAAARDPLFDTRTPAPARVVRSAAAAAQPPGPALAIEEPPRSPPPAAPSPAPMESLGGLFERFVGGRLLIWAGGIALAVAGLFLVRFSIQIGLITPPVQMGLAALFGLLLLGLGEYARSRPGAVPDMRVAQALVGAAILVLYATAYGSFIVHHLIGRGTTSALLSMMTAVALILSLRHGAPTAVMGLAGGFATPLLVGDADAGAVPLLAYLALLDIALFAVASRRGWSWLVASGVLLSFAWTAALIFAKPADNAAVGAFILIVSVAASLVRTGGGWQVEFIRPAAIGLVQLALLVAATELDTAAWILFAALAIASFLLAPRRSEYRPIPALALALALVLLAVKAGARTDPNIALVAAGIVLIFGSGGFWGAARRGETLLWTGIGCAAFLFPAAILRAERPELLVRPLWGALFAGLALGPVLLGWLAARREGRAGLDPPLSAAGAAALLLGGLAAWDLASEPLVPAAWLALAVLAAAAGRRTSDRGLSLLALAAAALASAEAVTLVPRLWSALAGALFGDPALVPDLPPALRAAEVLLLPVPLLLLVWRTVPADHHRRWRTAPLALAGALGAVGFYVLFKRVYGLDTPAEFASRGFAERTILTQALFAAGFLVCRGRAPRLGLDRHQLWWAGIALTGLAAARLLWFDMLVDNPLWVEQNVGAWPVLNLLLPAYLLSALWLYAARRGADHVARSGLWLVLGLAALILGIALQVRQVYHGAILTGSDVTDAESYTYSAAGVLLAIALLLGGVRLPDKALRLAGLILLTAMALKAFLMDAAALEGVLRILSFLGLGVALIFIGKLYTKVLNAEAAT
ncbi:MAG: hypothetical protein QOE79_1765 [Sphingomonadales bacterium]|jgi:uncharacterized membrane protein|nr:hypothetical protein [Sphingomonadales bacterium]